MNYYHTDDPSMVLWLANVMTTAAERGRKVRLKTTSRNELFIKVGEGAWTAPFASTPDPYRDHSVEVVNTHNYLGVHDHT